MRLKAINGSEIKINLSTTQLYTINTAARSKFQQIIGNDLTKLYPSDKIFSEVFIPIENFYLDFFIPSLNIVIEVNGNQHNNYVKYFHKTLRDFNNQKNRDVRKRDWCKLNNFKLIEIDG